MKMVVGHRTDGQGLLSRICQCFLRINSKTVKQIHRETWKGYEKQEDISLAINT